MFKKYLNVKYLNIFLIVASAIILGIYLYKQIKARVFKENFTIKSGDKALVFIRMEGCGFCDKLKPEWNKAEKENNTNFQMYTVDKDKPQGKMLCNKFNVQQFPTILLLDEKYNKIGEYKRERTANGLLAYLKSL